MRLNALKTAMANINEATAKINSLDDSERSCHIKSEMIGYVMHTLLEEYVETQNKLWEGEGYTKAKELLIELIEDIEA